MYVAQYVHLKLSMRLKKEKEDYWCAGYEEELSKAGREGRKK